LIGADLCHVWLKAHGLFVVGENSDFSEGFGYLIDHDDKENGKNGEGGYASTLVVKLCGFPDSEVA
jgi:hypothetical protein